ncbi:MAG TPA: acyl-CoA dehydrogenase family protein, partial [Acidimicrobiia bacterium]|nr:acyl-CoA dehydrogenase family protein [Acidimicrobiia bacterium]
MTLTPAERVRGALRSLLDGADPVPADPVAFRSAVFDHGLAWVHFPPGWGGLGVDPHFQGPVDEQLRAAGPVDSPSAFMVGMELVAPTLAVHGTDHQRHAYLRRIFTCEDLWCQLFSEPGAGSDLASLATLATRVDGGWSVTGQKVWTTMAHRARWGLLLARTDPDVVKHKGITCFVVDMSAPGVEVRPLRQLTGDAEFNEVFLTEVRIPDSQRVGDAGRGWSVAMTTLGNERLVGDNLLGAGRGAGPIATAVGLWARPSTERTPGLRDELLRLWAAAEVARLSSLRSAALRGAGLADPTVSMAKNTAAQLQQRIYNLASRLRGAEALLIDGYEMVQRDQVAQLVGDDTDLNKALLASLASTIA